MGEKKNQTKKAHSGAVKAPKKKGKNTANPVSIGQYGVLPHRARVEGVQLKRNHKDAMAGIAAFVMGV